MLRTIAFALLACCLTQAAHADTIVLNRNQKNSSGVQIIAGGWSAKNIEHTDATYRAFNSLRSGNLSRYDYYYTLEINPQFKSKFNTCENNPNFRSFFQSLFGVAKGAVVVVKADVQYRWTTGNAVDFLKGDPGLVIAATGSGGASGQPGNGCYFDETMVPTFPLLQYGGGQTDQKYDDFVIKFIVAGGKSENLNAIQNLVGLFSQISALAGWTAISSGIASAEAQTFQKTAQSFQLALQSAGAFQNQISLNYTLKANGGPNDGRIAITIPGLFGDGSSNGYMAIYVRKQGSIALADASPSINPSTVFDNQVLPNRQCNPTAIASGKCDTNNDTLRIALAKLLVGLDDKSFKAPSPSVLLLDANSTERQKLIYETCKSIRTVARLNMHLSTLDEMLIRWAATKEGHVQDALKDEVKAKALAAANNVSVSELQDMCWNAGDEQTLNGMAALLKKKI